MSESECQWHVHEKILNTRNGKTNSNRIWVKSSIFKKGIFLLIFQAEDWLHLRRSYLPYEVGDFDITWNLQPEAVNKHNLHIRRLDQECLFTMCSWHFFGFKLYKLKRLVQRKQVLVILRIYNNILSCWENIYIIKVVVCKPSSGQFYVNNAEKGLLKTLVHVQPRTIPASLTLFSDRIR